MFELVQLTINQSVRIESYVVTNMSNIIVLS